MRAEARFLEKVIELHLQADGKPCVVGNCQAGWAVMMLAAVRPELFGPLIIPGSPLSYWAGVGARTRCATPGRARRQLADRAHERPRRRHLRRRPPGQQLRGAEPGQHLLVQGLQPVVQDRHRGRALPRIREVVGRPRQPQRRGRSSGSSTSCSSATGWRPARSSPAMASASTCATSARRSSASAPRATTSRRRSRPSAGSLDLYQRTTTSRRAARRSSMRSTRASATSASSFPAAWRARNTTSSRPTSTSSTCCRPACTRR